MINVQPKDFTCSLGQRVMWKKVAAGFSLRELQVGKPVPPRIPLRIFLLEKLK
jgi:hypothetical protein